MFKNITLEISLKAFKQTDDAYISKICKQIFQHWTPLLKNRKKIAVMLWASDGSEILDYSGDLECEFEWGRFLGTANLPYLEENAPRETSLHVRKQDYMQNPPKMTYAILKKIIETIKSESKKLFPDTEAEIGATFDIGPEFAISDFKYNRHREITSGAKIDAGYGFVDSTAKLDGDDFKYAAYPTGIPSGTPFGTFFGAQSKIYLKDMGFDFIWLSNGLGFSANPWEKTGKIFDGENFRPENLEKTKEKVFEFWKLFRDACPDVPIKTRGTNNSVGLDYSSDGVPLYDIYNADLGITAPPNSPWAAINDDYGLEMMGHMTRICELPNEVFPFRYYLHDCWWVNSPWYDRYDGSPCDIYLPMAISRITADGKTESANSFNIFTLDNSFGDMPDSCVNESLPHILKAEKDIADAPSPLVWVYPMREYTTSSDASDLKEMHTGDNFIADAINNGLPLCCVTSSDSFLCHDANLYNKSSIVTPVPTNEKVLAKLIDFANKGIGILMYGSKEKLDTVKDYENIKKIDTSGNSENILKEWETFGYSVKFAKKNASSKAPASAIVPHDNGLFVSVYNPDTTTETMLKFPIGAPILCGAETEIIDGRSTYHFSRGEHRECRIFVDQKDGVISCREAAPVNARYRRAIYIRGLKDATVSLFSEKGCECAVSTYNGPDDTPEYDDRFTAVNDETYGTYLKGEHISGNIYFIIGKKGTE